MSAWSAVVDFVSEGTPKVVALGAWLIDKATNTDNWKALGDAFMGAFGGVIDFVVWAASRHGQPRCVADHRGD